MRDGPPRKKLENFNNKNTNKNIMDNTTFTSLKRGIKLATSLSLGVLMTLSSVGGAQARILFQDDSFSIDYSEGFIYNFDDTGDEDVTIQLGNDGTDGSIIWDDLASELQIGDGVGSVSVDSDTWDISAAGVGSGFAGFDSTGTVNFSGSSQFRIREESFGGNFTNPGAPACANDGELAVDTDTSDLYICTDNTTNTWTLVSAAAGDFLSAIADDTYGDAAGAQTLTIGDGTNADALVAAANSVINLSGAAEFRIPVGTANASGDACSTTGELYFNTANDEVLVCNGTNFLTTGPQEFEDVYAADTDNTLDTDDGDFSINTGTGETDITSGTFDINSADIDADITGGVDLEAGGAISFDGVGASNFTTDSGDLTLSTTTSGDVAINSADDVTITSGDDIIFDDAQLTGNVQLTDTATDFDAALPSDGIIDNINAFTSTANGEGASLVGIEDASGYFTATDVEGALDELGAAADNENTVITLEPEYPNVVVFQDGTNNRGRLEADYDETNREQYYRWTTQRNAEHDIDLRVRYELPTDFNSTGDLTLRLLTDTTTVGDNSVAIIVRDDTADATCHSDGQVVAAAAGTWETVTITAAEINAGCTLTAGDIIEVQIKLAADNTSSGGAQVGTLEHDYTN